jgi:hypothetical protein
MDLLIIAAGATALLFFVLWLDQLRIKHKRRKSERYWNALEARQAEQMRKHPFGTGKTFDNQPY